MSSTSVVCRDTPVNVARNDRFVSSPKARTLASTASAVAASDDGPGVGEPASADAVVVSEADGATEAGVALAGGTAVGVHAATSAASATASATAGVAAAWCG